MINFIFFSIKEFRNKAWGRRKQIWKFQTYCRSCHRFRESSNQARLGRFPCHSFFLYMLLSKTKTNLNLWKQSVFDCHCIFIFCSTPRQSQKAKKRCTPKRTVSLMVTWKLSSLVSTLKRRPPAPAQTPVGTLLRLLRNQFQGSGSAPSLLSPKVTTSTSTSPTSLKCWPRLTRIKGTSGGHWVTPRLSMLWRATTNLWHHIRLSDVL